MKVKFFLMCFIASNFFSLALKAQAIVNIEEMRRDGEVGFFSSAALNIDGARGNRDRDFYSVQLRLDLNSEQNESFIIFQDSKRQSNNKIIDKSRFLHARYIWLGGDKVSWEFFTQFSENPFRNYKERAILGGGLRLKLSDNGRLGLGVIHEKEEDIVGNKSSTERLSSYFHNRINVAENVDFNTTIYFQPNIDSFENDYKASMILGLNFNVNTNLIITMQYSIFHDSSPLVSAEKSDEGLSTKFSYDLSNLWKG